MQERKGLGNLGCVHEHTPCSQINCKSEDGGPWAAETNRRAQMLRIPRRTCADVGCCRGVWVEAGFGPVHCSGQEDLGSGRASQAERLMTAECIYQSSNTSLLLSAHPFLIHQASFPVVLPKLQ
jgi:hypothetical protein